jgi:hypothetical protein
MVFAKPELYDGVTVFLCSITLVAVPPVVRELDVKLPHMLIPPGFSKDAGGRYRGEGRITLDDAPVRYPLIAGEAVAVY